MFLDLWNPTPITHGKPLAQLIRKFGRKKPFELPTSWKFPVPSVTQILETPVGCKPRECKKENWVYMLFEGPISSPKRTVLAHQDYSGRNSRTNVGTGLSVCAKARRISRSKKRRCAMFCGSVLRSSTSVLAVSFSASHSRFLTTILERSVPEVPEMFTRPCLRLCQGQGQVRGSGPQNRFDDFLIQRPFFLFSIQWRQGSGGRAVPVLQRFGKRRKKNTNALFLLIF